MSVGTNIKKLRRERDMTQEALAEYLGISVGAVSQWECDRTSPDISQLPLLANIFDVTTDELLGVDQTKSSAKIKTIAEEASKYYAKGDFVSSAEILRKGLKEYPRSYYLMVKLAGSVHGEEAITLSEKVISECTDSELRYEAIQNAVLNNKLLGNMEQACEYANMMPSAFCSKEDLLMFILSGSDAFDNLRDYAKFCVSRLFIILSKLTEMKDKYNVEERIKLCKQRIRIGETVYCDGDYNYYSDLMANAYSDLSYIYAERKNRDGVISALKSEAEFRDIFDTYDTSSQNTSPAVKGYVDGGWIRSNGERTVDQLAETLEKDPVFDFIRSDPGFKSVIDSLKRCN